MTQFSYDSLGRLVGMGGFVVVEGVAYTESCRVETENVLPCIPQHPYFRTRYREMFIILDNLSGSD